MRTSGGADLPPSTGHGYAVSSTGPHIRTTDEDGSGHRAVVPTPRTRLPTQLAHRPFTVAEGLALGLTEKAMRHPDLRAPHRGVRVPAHLPDDLRTRCVAVSLLLPAGSAFLGATAAALWGLPLPRDVDPGARHALPIEVGVPRNGPRPRVCGTTVRFVSPSRRRAAPGRLLLASPSHAWAALGNRLALDDLVVLGDAAARLDGTRQDLERRLSEPARLSGRRRLEAALHLVRERVDSPQETRTRLVVVRAGIPEPAVNVPARDEGGGWLGCPDLAWHRPKVALEYLGDVHRVKKTRWRADVRRREVLEDHGWKVLFATADDLARYPDQLVQRIDTALRERCVRW